MEVRRVVIRRVDPEIKPGNGKAVHLTQAASGTFGYARRVIQSGHYSKRGRTKYGRLAYSPCPTLARVGRSCCLGGSLYGKIMNTPLDTGASNSVYTAYIQGVGRAQIT